MSSGPERKLAAHVQAAVAGRAGVGAQAKMARQANVPAGGQRSAAHVQAAVVQTQKAGPAGARPAHVAAAVAQPSLNNRPGSSAVGAKRAAPAPPPLWTGAPRPQVAQLLPSGALYDAKQKKNLMDSGFTPNKQQQKSGRYWLDEGPEGVKTWWYFDRGPDLTNPADLIVGGYMRNPDDFWQDDQGGLSFDPEWSYLDPYANGMTPRPGSYEPSSPHDPLTRKVSIDEQTVKESTLWWYDKLRRLNVTEDQLKNVRQTMKGKWDSGMGAPWWEALRRAMIKHYHQHFWLRSRS